MPTTGPESGQYEQFRMITTGSGEFVIYDTDREDAWVQSSLAVELDEQR
jgi:hypothetical protein